MDRRACIALVTIAVACGRPRSPPPAEPHTYFKWPTEQVEQTSRTPRDVSESRIVKHVIPSVPLAECGIRSPVRGGAICGHTTASDGSGLVGVTVSVSSPALDARVESAFTNDSGAYVIANLPPGTYIATFFYLDCTGEQRDVPVADGEATQVDAEFTDTACRATHIPLD